ncbi:MAG: fatty acid oxidation complex subunit alpha FadJ [Balneolales bacterium]
MKTIKIKKVGELALITLDQPKSKVNTLTTDMLSEFEQGMKDLEKDTRIRAVVLLSGKQDNFIAGADLRLIRAMKKGDAGQFSREGNRLLSWIAAFPKPVVAAIHGACLGGGLEVALACHYRIATDDPKTKLALPEVKLGLLPAAGGTQRLPRLIGIPGALDMMLTGKNLYARQAKKNGLVDEVIYPKGLVEAAKTIAARMAAGRQEVRKSPLNFKDALLEKTAAGRRLIYGQARKKVQGETHGNYPAPLKIIESVRIGMEKGMEAGLEAESGFFDELVFTSESRMLVNLFFAMQDAKKNPYPAKVRPVHTVGVLGAGLMGSGITEVSVQAGYSVLLKDRDLVSAGNGLQRLWSNYEKKVSRKIISPFDRDREMGMITPVDDFLMFKKADLVIEAVFEDLKLKQAMLAEVEKKTPDHCIFASNTSSLPISDIAKKAKRPANVLGMHYFSPVQKMPLLEIVRTKKTSDQAIATAYEAGVKQGKTIIVVSDGPGFYTTRILAPYMNETMKLLEEGIGTADLDHYMKAFGFPVGPAALMDEVGLDVCAHVSEIMAEVFTKRKQKPSTSVQTLLDAGYKGRKNKKGFYLYGNGLFNKKKEVNEDVYQYIGGKTRKEFEAGEVQERMALSMVNEAAHCLQEGIIGSARDADSGAVFGLGFPPFRGGPFRYIDHEGPGSILEKLKAYEQAHGARFSPAQILKDYGRKNRKFYTD